MSRIPVHTVRHEEMASNTALEQKLLHAQATSPSTRFWISSLKARLPAKSNSRGGLGVPLGFSGTGNLAVTSEVLALARPSLCAKTGSVPMEIITSCNIHTIISLSEHKECKIKEMPQRGCPMVQLTRDSATAEGTLGHLGWLVPAAALEVNPKH